LISLEQQEILHYIKATRRFEPELYSIEKFQAALLSRLESLRMNAHVYLDELQVRPSEVDLLLLSTVQKTSLPKDETLWSTLRSVVVPYLTSSPAPVRVWCVGSRSGIDAYALAVLLAEGIGLAEFCDKVKIFATDEDDGELNANRSGVYDAADLGGLEPDLLVRYFSVQPDGRYAFRSDLRKQIIFGKHRFLDDAPISRMDLVVYRYQLAFQDLEHQQRSLNKMLFSVNTGGFLLVGNGEGIPAGYGFQQMDSCPALYRKTLRNRMQFNDSNASRANSPAAMLEETVLDVCGPAQIVVDSYGTVALANLKARTTFGITSADLGKAVQELEISYRPLELRSHLEKCSKEGEVIKVPNVPKLSPEGVTHFEVVFRPLLDNGRVLGTSIQFLDVSIKHELASQVVVLNEQLQAANEELQSAHEELVTTNEELQSTNEELETTNEELQSTNEELETMNEELRSTNNELEVTNSAQRELATDLERNNTFLSCIVDSIDASIIVLNTSYCVLVWNKKAEDTWGVRSEEVIGQNFFGLDIGFPVERLKSPLRNMNAGSDEELRLEVEAINRRGKKVMCKVSANPLSPSSPSGFLVIIGAAGELN
jgi:two-component system CheB/CheR fusion protein